jgi:hypothetical protein
MSNAQGNFNPFDAITARIKSVGYDNLNDYEKGYYAVWWFVTEVNDGGLHQFFFNSSGGYLPEVRMGLRMMGATQTLGIFDRAIGLLGRPELPRDDAERRDIVLKLSPDAEAGLDELTDEFYNSSEDLSGLGQAFVASNRDQFGGG